MTSITNEKNPNLDQLNESNIILPFHYNGKIKDFYEYVNAQGFNHRKGMEQSDYTWIKTSKRTYRYLATHINTLIDNENPDSICLSYHLNSASYSNLSLPSRGTKVTMTSKIIQGLGLQEEFFFYLYGISLYLFKTGIGFFIINVKHEENESLNSIADKAFSLTRFYTKEPDRTYLMNNCITFKYKAPDSENMETQDIFFSLSNVVNQLLNIKKTPEDKITLFPTSSKNECHVFHRICINNELEQDDLQAKLYLLRRAFHTSFFTNITDACLDNATDYTYQTQHNNYFSFCQKGIVCLYYPTANREVFLNHFKNNIRYDYFFIYIFLLHERQALFYYNSIILLSKRKSGKLIQMKKLLINFRMNYTYKVISDESSYQNFYNQLHQALSLPDLNSEIQDIIDRATEHQKSIHESSTNTALAILALFGVFSAFDSCFSVVDRLYCETPLSSLHYIFVILIVLMIISAITIFIGIKKRK